MRDLAGITPTAETSFLRRPQVRARTGLSDTRIDELEKLKRFPRRVALSSRAIGWVKSEVDSWIQDRIGARDAGMSADSGSS